VARAQRAPGGGRLAAGAWRTSARRAGGRAPRARGIYFFLLGKL